MKVAWDRFALAAAAVGVLDFAMAMLHKANVVEASAYIIVRACGEVQVLLVGGDRGHR